MLSPGCTLPGFSIFPPVRALNLSIYHTIAEESDLLIYGHFQWMRLIRELLVSLIRTIERVHFTRLEAVNN